MTRKLDITGLKFGRWTALEFAVPTGVFKNSTWKCQCDCGEIVDVLQTSLIQGKSKSCGCLRKEINSKIHKTHGMSTSIEYRHYAGMMSRCFNKNSDDYPSYGAVGITVCREFVDDFLVFYNEIGPKPIGAGRRSVGRIDNTLGYILGNVRWENDDQQARNHSLQSNNKTGHAGVTLRATESDGIRVIARYSSLEGNRVSKSFSVRIFGMDTAVSLAAQWRKDMIEKLNEAGADYAESHGADKVFYVQ